MADDALVHEKTRVEKVNDTYHYYLTFKNLQFGALVGTVDSLSVDGKAAERTDLGGEGNEKLFHFTSVEKLTEKTINFAVSTNGKPLKGHSNVPATLNFNWNDATPLTTDQVTAAHQEETKKAQKAEADRLEKERLEKEAAAKAQAEKERLEKEKAQKAEADRLEKERLEKEAAAKAQAEKEKAKLEELKKVALSNIATDKDVNKEEASKLKEIVNSASLKDTLVAKVVENGSTEEITVSFDNTSLQADKFVIEKADKETVAKVEELVKKAEENLSVVKTIDLHFIDSKGTTINKQGETRAVTVAVVANEDEKLEVYYVNGNKLEKVPSVYKDGKLTFFTNHFSIYTIVKSKTVSSDQNTPVPITPAPSDKNEEIKSDKGEALVQEELPALDLDKVLNETTQKDSLNILGQTDNKEIKDNDNLDVVKTNNQVTSATPVNTVKKGLANTGLASTATAGLGALVLLSALVLRRKFNK